MPYSEETPESGRLFDRACQLSPGGVNSPVRAFRAVGGTPRFMVRGQGCYVHDADGRDYVDLVCSWGPLILGHAHPAVVAAVADTASQGLSFGAPTPRELGLAAEIVRRVSPLEQIRFVSSGTEATMSAIRLARGVTGRNRIVKFAGCYHGHVDALLVGAGSGVATLGLPNSPGVTVGQAGDTIVLPYNDLPAVQETFANYGNEIAGVITEAVPANMGIVPPQQGFNAALRAITAQHNALLIVDEVLTGFRVSPAGWQGIDPVNADLFTFGKVIGGGLPAAAFGGRADIMANLAPVGAVYQAGTLSGNPVAMAAGLTTLQHCTPEIYQGLDNTAREIQRLVSDALKEQGVPHQIQAAGNLFSVFFTASPVANFSQAQQQNTDCYAAFFHAMLAHGIYLPPSAFEAWFVSAAHDDQALSKIANALPHAAAAAARAGGKEIMHG